MVQPMKPPGKVARVVKEEHDWDKIFATQVSVFVEGRDFTCSQMSFHNYVYRESKRRNVKVRLISMRGRVIVVVPKMFEDE